jgi:hypothetical protein
VFCDTHFNEENLVLGSTDPVSTGVISSGQKTELSQYNKNIGVDVTPRVHPVCRACSVFSLVRMEISVNSVSREIREVST